jgi:hypothetical protein
MSRGAKYFARHFDPNESAVILAMGVVATASPGRRGAERVREKSRIPMLRPVVEVAGGGLDVGVAHPGLDLNERGLISPARRR